jgi:hypothetical protein
MAKQKNYIEKLVLCSIILVVLFGIWIKPHIFATNVSGVVTEKNHKNDIYKILVRLDSGFIETFENSDVFYRLKFNSGDIQANVEVNKRYNFKVIGRRNYILSAYRKILSYNEENK